jgi:hypothetical protein
MAQQGNGTTTVNKKPTLVHGFENTKIAKVSCGSSHSIAWTIPESTLRSTNDTVLFSDVRDPLGIHSLGFTETFEDPLSSYSASAIENGGFESPDPSNSETSYEKNSASKSRIPKKVQGRPSLAKIILSMDSVAAQQNSLLQLLNSLQIMYARMAVVAALTSHKSGIRNSASRRSSKSKLYWDSDIYDESAGSLPSYSSPFHSVTGSVIKEELFEGGGEAPADGTLENLVTVLNECLQFHVREQSNVYTIFDTRMKLWHMKWNKKVALLAYQHEIVCHLELLNKLKAT